MVCACIALTRFALAESQLYSCVACASEPLHGRCTCQICWWILCSSTVVPVQITVAMTPNGRADAVAQLEDGANCFALPHEEQMGFEAFLALLSDKQAERVVYAQAQNDSLRQEFAQLMPDIDPELAWAAEIFGQPPDAVNLWIGDSRSVTTFHRDFYENMYGMVAGSKTFTLLPPCDSYRLHKQHVPVARYRLDEMQGWSLQLQQAAEQISWCPIDRDTVKTGSATAAAQQHRFPDFFNEGLPPPLEVILHPGDMLYLPCMWHHMVEQDEDLSGQVIAVNFWFNQHFGTHYAANVFAEKVGRTVAV